MRRYVYMPPSLRKKRLVLLSWKFSILLPFQTPSHPRKWVQSWITLMLYVIILANRYVSLNNIYAYYNLYKNEIKLYAMDGLSRCSTNIIRRVHFANLMGWDIFSLPDCWEVVYLSYVFWPCRFFSSADAPIYQCHFGEIIHPFPIGMYAMPSFVTDQVSIYTWVC